LEAALKGATDQQDKARLAQAAMRFLRDYEVRSAGPSVTMSWSFELRGQKGRHRGGIAGLPERSLAAEAILQEVSKALGDQQFILIENALIKQHSQRRLCADFGMAAARLLEALRQGLRQLEHIYDHRVRAEA